MKERAHSGHPPPPRERSGKTPWEDHVRSRKLYLRRYTVAFGLAFAALGGFSAPLAAQRPERVAPAPPASQEGPETPTPAAPQADRRRRRGLARRLHALCAASAATSPAPSSSVVKDGQVLLEQGLRLRRRRDSARRSIPRRTLFRPGLGLQAVHLDGGDAAGRAGQARPRRRRQHATSTSRSRRATASRSRCATS